MAKARGNKLVPPANFSRNPMGATPSVNIWNGGAMQRSPSPMTYADPSTNPNQGMYDLARNIDAIRDRSQSRPQNPMVPGSPTFGVTDLDTEAARRFAPMMARDAARQQNTPMNGMTAYEANPMRYRPDDPALQARQQDNAQRATRGRPMDRTRDSSALNAYIASGGTPWYEREKQARDAMAWEARLNDPGVQAALAQQRQQKIETAALRNRENPAANQDEQDRRNNADVARREREARHNQFKDANNGMNYRQYDRMQNQNALTMKAVDEGRLSPDAANLRMQTRADKALRRSGNPMMMGTDASRRLFPDMTAGRGGKAATPNQNPMAAFGMGASNTPVGKVAAAGNVSAMATTDPNLVALGVDPAAGIGGLHTSLSQQFEADPNLAMDDSSLRSYQMFAQQALTADPDQANPSNFASFPGSVFAETEGAVTSELWKELATLPDSESARQQWLQKYKDRKKEIEKRQTDYYGSYGS